MRDDDPPNLFVIGAPKCGTTSLFDWLAGHPEVCPSDPKETKFFTDAEIDLLGVRPNHRDDGLAAYLALFEPVGPATRVKVDGSTHHLYSRTAVRAVPALEPRPRAIVQLREPAARVRSHLAYTRQRSPRPIRVDLPMYVDRMLAADPATPPVFTDQPWQQHLLANLIGYSTYVDHLEPWARLLGDDLLVLLMEETVRDPTGQMRRIAAWLGIDPDWFDDAELTASNVTGSRTLHRLERRAESVLRSLPAAVVERFLGVARAVDGRLRARSPSPRERAALTRLRTHFAPANARLADLLDLDLSPWAS